MSELPQARVCHLTSGRLRLKIPEKRGDDGFFGTVRERLSGWDAVQAVAVNPLTGSVLVHFADPAALVAENAQKNDLFAVAYEEMTEAEVEAPLIERAARGFAAADAAVRRWTAGGADLRGSLFVALLAGGLYQLARGNIAAPAATLLWYAGEMLHLRDTAPTAANRSLPESAAAEG
jgi:hypothetical protein